MSSRWSTLSALAAVATAVLGSLCCVGPLALVVMGVGAGGLLAEIEAYRPVFTALSVVFLALGFFVAHRRRRRAACECESGKSSRARQILFWLSVPIAVGLVALPYLAKSHPSKACCLHAEGSK